MVGIWIGKLNIRMNKNNFNYNNEAIATMALGYFLHLKQEIELSKILFVLPFILHEPCLKKLKGTSIIRSLEEFIIKSPETLMGFNSRYFNYLPLAINGITILKEAEIIYAIEDVLYFNNNTEFDPINNFTIGSRAKQLLRGIEALIPIINSDSAASFYLKLKITL